MSKENGSRRRVSTWSNAADMLSKMRAENWPLDSGIQRTLVTLTRALSEW